MAPPGTRSRTNQVSSSKVSSSSAKDHKRARESLSTVDDSPSQQEDSESDPVLPPKRPVKGKGKAAVRSRKKAVKDNAEHSDTPQPTKPKVKPRKKKRRQVSPEHDNDSDSSGAASDEEVEILEAKHDAPIPEMYNTKQAAEDVYTIFTPMQTSKVFLKGGRERVEAKGRWCTICRDIKKGDAKDEAFLRGGVSSCRGHCKQHWEIYKQRCEAKNIPLRTDAMPPKVLSAFRKSEAEAAAEARGEEAGAGTLDVHLTKQLGPREFTTDGVLENVAKYVTCCDKPLATANNMFFRNALVSMRPKSKSSELPSTHKVCTFIHNHFIQYLDETKAAIEVALGKIAMTGDGWSADNTKQPYMGATGCWVDVDPLTRVWSVQHKVVGFKGIFGAHDGSNMAGYLFGICRRVGIVNVEKKISKLGPITLDNAANNGTMCQKLEYFHIKLDLSFWIAADNQLMCFAHSINLGVVDVMGCITRKAAIETTNAIWDYDPLLEKNRMMNGSLDAVAALRTLAVKIQASGQRIQQFNKLQLQCGIDRPYKITMHGNTRWGTAFGMMDRGIKLGKAINLFVRTADQLYGPITTIRQEGQATKKIQWSAFEFGEDDWARLRDGKALLEDADAIQQKFSSGERPTLWKVIPAIEGLLTKWEEKRDDERFIAYRDALEAGITKIQKYYAKIDRKWWYILAMFIHPYYKLDWFRLHWGGEAEQQAGIDAGNPNAKDWYDEALQVVERIMAEYWEPNDTVFQRQRAAHSSFTKRRAGEPAKDVDDEAAAGSDIETEFDRERARLAAEQPLGFDGWRGELREWLKLREGTVTKKTDLCAYWAKNCDSFPTIARIALDVIPAQGSSVPCERLFSGSKQTADDLRAALGHERFEELQILKWEWKDTTFDFAKANDEHDDYEDDRDAQCYADLLKADEELDMLDKMLA